MEAETLAAGIAAGIIVLSCAQNLRKKKNKLRRQRRWWMLSIHKSRGQSNGLTLLADLQKEPSGKFMNFCRMSAEDFEMILNKIGPHISKQDTNMRKAISIQERLAITLRFLATGDSFTSIGYLFKVSNQTISVIVPEVCKAINEGLKDQIKIPRTQQEWMKIANGFQYYWNFPHCLGAIDGKHIVLQAPFNSESEYFNYKKSFSIVLMALVDYDYNFTFVDIGAQGRMNDAGVFVSTTLYKKMIQNELSLPPMEPLIGREKPVPYVFIGDDAFPMSRSLLKPYCGTHLKNSMERIYNYRLCRARRVVENVFGILASVFRVLRAPMLLQPEKAALVCMTCTQLHNFLRESKTSRNSYTPNGSFDIEVNGQIMDGTWRKDSSMISLIPLPNKPRKPSHEAKGIQKEYAEYFVSNGAVAWQNNIN